MNRSHGTIGQKIARTVRAFEKQRTNHGRKWVAVFLNEDTIAIALHGSLTTAEKALAQSPVGASQVREEHRKLFVHDSATLLQKIKTITGMGVRSATAEIQLATGSVVHVFTTDTVAEQFLLALSAPTDTPRRTINKAGGIVQARSHEVTQEDFATSTDP